MFKIEVLRWLVNAISRFVSMYSKCVLSPYVLSTNCSTSIMWPSALQILPDFDDVLTELYLNFLKFQNWECYTSHIPPVASSLKHDCKSLLMFAKLL